MNKTHERPYESPASLLHSAKLVLRDYTAKHSSTVGCMSSANSFSQKLRVRNRRLREALSTATTLIGRPPGPLRRRPSRTTDPGRPPNRTRKPALDRYRWAAGGSTPATPPPDSAAGRRVAGRNEANAIDRAPITHMIEKDLPR